MGYHKISGQNMPWYKKQSRTVYFQAIAVVLLNVSEIIQSSLSTLSCCKNFQQSLTQISN